MIIKKIQCRDTGANCDFVATGTSYEEVIKEILTHSQENHKEQISKIIETYSPQEIKLIFIPFIKE